MSALARRHLLARPGLSGFPGGDFRFDEVRVYINVGVLSITNDSRCGLLRLQCVLEAASQDSCRLTYGLTVQTPPK